MLVSLIEQLGGASRPMADATPENGGSIIGSSGYAVRKTPTRADAHLHREGGRRVGRGEALRRVGRAPVGVSVEEYSLDGGKTWVAAPATLQAKTTIAGLTPGATVQIRYLPITLRSIR